MKIKADLHLHSCLSPCGQDEMTPCNIAGMCYLKGLNLIALTDHNTAGNLPAIMSAAQQVGITVVPGIEISTCEDVHILGYFPSLEGAMQCSAELYKSLPDIPNKPQFFGEQQFMDENDNILANEPRLLINPLTLSSEQVCAAVRAFGGVPVPAHIDSDSHGMVSVLGFINPKLGFNTVEISPRGIAEGFAQFDPRMKVISSSDAHWLGKIFEPEQAQELDLPECTAAAFCAWLDEKQ